MEMRAGKRCENARRLPTRFEDPRCVRRQLAYYYDNREEIDAELAEDQAWAESLGR